MPNKMEVTRYELGDIPDLEDLYGKLERYIDSLKLKDQGAGLLKDIRSYLNHPKEKNFEQIFGVGQGDTQLKRFNRLQVIRQLYLGFNIPFEIFSEELTNKHMMSDRGLSHLLEFRRLAFDPDNDDPKVFALDYQNTLKPYISEAQERIWVYEYLGKGGPYKSGLALPHYGEAHKEIFRAIEEQLANNKKTLALNTDKNAQKLTYKRLLVLPLQDKILKNPVNLSPVQKKHYTVEALIECSTQVFHHICRCFINFSENVEFYIVSFPPRIYHFGLLDNTVVSEYYRYKSGGDFMPDLLFVEKEMDIGNKKTLYHAYYTEFNALIGGNSKRCFKIDADGFALAALDALAKITLNLEGEQSKEPFEKEEEVWMGKKERMLDKIGSNKNFFSKVGIDISMYG